MSAIGIARVFISPRKCAAQEMMHDCKANVPQRLFVLSRGSLARNQTRYISKARCSSHISGRIAAYCVHRVALRFVKRPVNLRDQALSIARSPRGTLLAMILARRSGGN